MTTLCEFGTLPDSIRMVINRVMLLIPSIQKESSTSLEGQKMNLLEVMEEYQRLCREESGEAAVRFLHEACDLSLIGPIIDSFDEKGTPLRSDYGDDDDDAPLASNWLDSARVSPIKSVPGSYVF